MASKRRVLLVGWDAADCKVISPLVDMGLMPHVGRLVETGVMGNLATLQPALSPMFWLCGILRPSTTTPSTTSATPSCSITRRGWSG